MRFFFALFISLIGLSFAQSNDIVQPSQSVTGASLTNCTVIDSLTASTADTVYYPNIAGDRKKCKLVASWSLDSGWLDVHLVNDPQRTYTKIWLDSRTWVPVIFDKIRKGLKTTIHLDSLTLYPR
jgi:hypothetical protein